jgi:hypothetical protein
MVKGRDVLEGEVDGEEERGEVKRGLVVKKKVRQRVRERAEERDNRLEVRRDIGGGAGLHGAQVNVPVMQDNEEILVSCRRFDREAPGQIGGCPLRSVGKGSKETGANSGMRDQSDGILFLPLSFLVFLVLEEGDTQEGLDEEEDSERRGSSEAGWGGNPSGGGNALPQLVEMTERCGERGERTCKRGWRLV